MVAAAADQLEEMDSEDDKDETEDEDYAPVVKKGRGKAVVGK